ncbi:telomere stability/silencing protein [Toxoplasma gondii VEG]|uniref:Telomere stability/silencing protein n=1 Tax=Toxoplasma gondii (strain ATCC 50861 / VEG) TaxID=432359 RepID=V4ZVA7_TOXGV|nr:telomere stability/silencing protein [Toxoplasma gondii VEG]CEL75187.1 TPA: hypothetical protein BN1205_019770 [Toxoplasma gondii VEG]
MLDLVSGATRTLAVLHVLPSWIFPPSLRGSAASPVSRIDFPVARFRLLDTLAMALACALVEREALPLSRRHLRPSDCGASLPSFSSVSRQICWTSEQEASEAIPQQGLESPVLSPFLRPLRIAPSQILLHLPARLSPLSSSAHSRASSSTLLLSFEELATLVLPRSSLSAVQGALDSLASNRSPFSGSSSLSSSTSSSFSEWTEAVRDTEGAHSDDEELCFLPGCFLFSAVRKRLSLPSDLSFRLLLGKRELRGNSLIPLSSLLVPTSSEEIEASHSPQSAALYLFSPARRSTSHSSAPPSLASSRSSSRPLFRLAPLLSVHLLFPLVGGKGGFGALLKKQRKKQSRAALNFDMSRDLSGRRIRHAQVVEKIKAWIAKKQQETRAVELLAEQAETLTLEAETKKKEPAPTLDESFVRSLKSNSEQMPMLVGEGLKEEKETQKALSLQKEQQRSISLAKVKKQSNWFLHQEMLDAEEEDEEDEEEDEDDEEDEDERDARSDSTAVTGPLRPPASRPSAQQAAVSVRGRKTLVTSGLSRLASLCGKSPSSPSSSASSSSSCSSSLPSSSCSSQVSRREEQTKTRSQEEEKAKAEEEKAKAETEKAKAEDENWTRKAESLDVHAFATAEDLEKNVHPEVLKKKLAMLGWKCGGRPAERAARLFLLKSLNGKPPPKHVLAAKKDGGRN